MGIETVVVAVGRSDEHRIEEIVDAGGWGDAQEAQTGGGPQRSE